MQGKLINFIVEKKLIGVELEIKKLYNKKFSWSRSRKFMNGNLIMLSSDNFETLFFGLIKGRNSR